MTVFDALTDSVISQNESLATLKPVVEKEILHHEILRTMSDSGMLAHLTFIGGTCLRKCYGSERLSEDLDFSADDNFSKDDLAYLGNMITTAIEKKYFLKTTVTPPKKEAGNTQTWKIKIVTRPERLDMPAQKINIDVCLLPSYEKKAVMLKNIYGIDSGTDGILLYAESLEEIFCDKLIAFANRPNRVKNRDLWDIHFLSQKNISMKESLLCKKLADRKISRKTFCQKFGDRINEILDAQSDFIFEMRRFLMPEKFTRQFESDMWWQYLINILENISVTLKKK